MVLCARLVRAVFSAQVSECPHLPDLGRFCDQLPSGWAEIFLW